MKPQTSAWLVYKQVVQRSIISTCHGQDSAGILYTEKIRYAKKTKKNQLDISLS